MGVFVVIVAIIVALSSVTFDTDGAEMEIVVSSMSGSLLSLLHAPDKTE